MSTSPVTSSVAPIAASPVPSTGAVSPVPADVAPTPPAGFVATTKVGRGLRPEFAQVNLALKMATEVRSSTTYTMVFGAGAPNQAVVADSLTLARAWTDKLRNAQAWYEYVRQEEHLAWKQALADTKPLQVPLETCLSRDASLADDFPSAKAFFAARKERSVKGAATRKQKAKAEAKATAATAAQTTSATAATTPVVNVSDPVKAAAVRLLN